MSMVKDRKKATEATSFSDFFRKAPSKEKKRVYAHVLDEATKRQKEQIARAEQLHLIDAR